MFRTVAVVNPKGGSAKTTTAVNLAGCLAESGKRALLIDLSEQADATYWCGIKDREHGVWEIFTGDGGDPVSLIQPSAINGVEVIPSSDRVIEAERVLMGRTGSETILRHQLSRLPSDRWDYVILDCPPSLGGLTVNALTATRSVIIPSETHVMCLNGFPHLLKLIEKVKEGLNPDLIISGILACGFDARFRYHQEVVELIRKHFGELTYKTLIRENIRLAESPSFSQPITQYDSRSTGAEDYRKFTQEFLAQNAQKR